MLKIAVDSNSQLHNSVTVFEAHHHILENGISNHIIITGKNVITVKAFDKDSDAELEYSITNIRATHKTGVPVKKASTYDFTKSFVCVENPIFKHFIYWSILN